jgi:hypothetical protein
MVRYRLGHVDDALARFEAASELFEIHDAKGRLASVNAYYYSTVLTEIGHEAPFEEWAGMCLRVSKSLLDEALALLMRGREIIKNHFDDGWFTLEAALRTVRKAQRHDYLAELLIARAQASLTVIASARVEGDRELLDTLHRGLDEAAEIVRLGQMDLLAVDLALARSALAELEGQNDRCEAERQQAKYLATKTGYRVRFTDRRRCL